MLGHLIRKEVLDQVTSPRFLILFTIGTLAIWLSLYAGCSYYLTCLKDYQFARAVSKDRVREIIESRSNPEMYAVGYMEHKPPTPTSIFVRGLESTLSRSILVASPLRVRWMIRSPAATEPILGLFPSLDLGMIVQVVLSLFVLLFTYDAVCGEKEAGTLRMMASFPMPRHRVLIGKLIGALIPTMAAFGLPLSLGLAVVLLIPSVHLTGLEGIRVALILVVFGLYLAVFACVGLLTSSLTHRAATSFVLAMIFWIATIIILPRLSLMVADEARPVPSVSDLEAEKKAFENVEVQRWWDGTQKWRKDHEQPGKEWSPEMWETWHRFYHHSALETRKVVESRWGRLDEAFRNRYNARLDLAVTLARFSPAFALNNAAVRLAGTGVDRHQRFQKAFDVYIKGFHFWRGEKILLERLKEANSKKYGKSTWDFSDMPRFVYRETWPGEDIRIALVDVGMLVLWGLVFFLGAYVATLRYDLR